MKQTQFMGTTVVPATKSAGEITEALINAGATQVAGDYENGKITGLRWTMKIQGREFLFAMPARVEPVYKKLRQTRQRSRASDADIRARAERIAWRQLFRWTQAQLAMIDTGMAEAGEVFYPYLHDGAKTVYAHFKESAFPALPPASAEPKKAVS